MKKLFDLDGLTGRCKVLMKKPISLCTIYPKEGFFTVLVVIGAREKVAVEAILPECTKEVREIYKKTKLGNGQKWLMIDLEDQGEVYEDIFRLIEIRKG